MTTAMLSRSKPQHAAKSGGHSHHAGSRTPAQASRASSPEVVPPYLQRKWSGGSASQAISSASPAMVMRKNKFSDCQGTQPNQIDAAVVRAARALGRATTAVGNAYGKPDSVAPARQQLFMDHFHTMSRGHLRDILGTYMSLEQAFDGDLKFECESTCPTTATTQVCGYAYSHQWFGGSGPIHICFDTAGCDFSGTGQQDQTVLVIHEAAHRHAGIDDKAYRWEAPYSTLSPKQAKDNADSYAWFAVLV